MIAGYTTKDGQVFCTECWPAQAAAGARPSRVLQSEDPEDPGSNFWVVDDCKGCHRG